MESTWDALFDPYIHATHGNNMASRVMVISKYVKKDCELVRNYRTNEGSKYIVWRVIDYRPNDDQRLIEEIYKRFKATDVILNFSDGSKFKWDEDENEYTIVEYGNLLLKMRSKSMIEKCKCIKNKKESNPDDVLFVRVMGGSWDTVFNPTFHATHGNSPTSHLLVITNNMKRDQAVLRSFTSQTEKSRIKWRLIDYKQTYRKLFEEITDTFCATDIIINFTHDIKIEWNTRAERYHIIKRGHLVDQLAENNLINDLLSVTNQRGHDSQDFIFLKLMNIWSSSNCILMSPVFTTGTNELDQLLKLIDKKEIENTQSTIVTIFTGTHGSRNSLESGFSNVNNLDIFSSYKTYDKFSQRVKELRKCRCSSGYPCACKIKFFIENIKDFHVCKNGIPCRYFLNGSAEECKFPQNYETQSQNLCKRILEQKPTILILAWCYSSNGDVCMALRQNAILSQMLMESDMRNMGIPSAYLNHQQKSVLRAAQEKKDIVIWGPTGSGKTILAVETVKIKISNFLNTCTQSRKKLSVYITTWYPGYDQLLDDFENKYFKSISEIADIKFCSFGQLMLEICGIDTDNDFNHLQPYLIKSCIDIANNLDTRQQTMIMIDELDPDYIHESEMKHLIYTDKISSVARVKHVDFVIAISPTKFARSKSKSSKFILMPPNTVQVSQHYQCLTHRYRNNIEILNFLSFLENQAPEFAETCQQHILHQKLEIGRQKSDIPDYILRRDIKPVIVIEDDQRMQDAKMLLEELELEPENISVLDGTGKYNIATYMYPLHSFNYLTFRIIIRFIKIYFVYIVGGCRPGKTLCEGRLWKWGKNTSFTGVESDIIVYIIGVGMSFNVSFYDSCSRARKLLILIDNSKFCYPEKTLKYNPYVANMVSKARKGMADILNEAHRNELITFAKVSDGRVIFE